MQRFVGRLLASGAHCREDCGWTKATAGDKSSANGFPPVEVKSGEPSSENFLKSSLEMVQSDAFVKVCVCVLAHIIFPR